MHWRTMLDMRSDKELASISAIHDRYESDYRHYVLRLKVLSQQNSFSHKAYLHGNGG